MVKTAAAVDKNSRSRYTENRIGKMCGMWKSVLKEWNKSNWLPQEVLLTKARHSWQSRLITSAVLSRNV